MTGWSDGSLTDIVHTRAVHRETTPVWLAVTAMLTGVQGHASPGMTEQQWPPLAYRLWR